MSETPVQVPGPEMAPAPPPEPQPFTERLSDTLQQWIGVIVGSQRKPPRRLKSLLNGTWLGHPLHPVITDVPVTSWLLTAVFDVIWLIAHPTWAAFGAFVTVIVGLLGALGAIVTGLTDWSDTYGAERRVGFNHALFNASATILYLISFILRLVAGPGDGVAAAILGFIGLASVSYAAYLGGDMVFTKGTGVNHTAWEAAGEDYEAVMPIESIEENKLYRVTVASVPVGHWMRGRSPATLSSAPAGTARVSACAMGTCSQVPPQSTRRATMSVSATGRWRSSASRSIEGSCDPLYERSNRRDQHDQFIKRTEQTGPEYLAR